MPILKNRIQCKKCLDIIESTHVHDFKWCKCRSIAVDGGRDYMKVCGDMKNIHDLSEGISDDGKPWPTKEQLVLTPKENQVMKAAVKKAMKEAMYGVEENKLYRLCFVEAHFAYFTTKPLTGEGCQWGDDWNDAPYEHNAGAPSSEAEGQIKIVAYKSDTLVLPCDGHANSPYSVEDLNAGAHPWLSSREDRVYIYAGCTPEHFKTEVEKAGGRVFL